ncbi:hypothetical protein OKW41_006266 [Paraburkholderia sp. UCT70]|uniref:hypothetical protein n=1 Tax=Paraburkholderia sp. UCT70 TaxID=2991068 RepID=UPI003D1A3E4C
MTPRELAISFVGQALGEMFGPLSLPPDEYFHVPDRKKIAASSAPGGNGVRRCADSGGGLDGVDFIGDEYAGLLSVLEAAVVMVERYVRTTG